VTIAAAAVIDGWNRNATVTGTRKNASRACENAPPDRSAITLIATMSTPVSTSASCWDTGRRYTQASTPALHAENATSATTNAVSVGFGCASPCPSASSAIAGRRSQATTRSASAAASREAGGSSARTYSIRPRRIALATAAARSETPSFSYRCWTCVFTVVSPR
jgi:hypothetical protein